MSHMVLNMDCVLGMSALPDNTVDAIVTDPPYELGFMGKSWDASGIAYNVAMWREALRVLKPGGHLLAFSGSRTYHRMTCAIEDAGFEVRDQIMWVYGSGFPKSLDVSKAIDKAAGVERTQVIGKSARHGVGIVGNGTSYEISPEVPTLYAPATDAARQWQGWGTALKPAHEPICVARKPLAGTVAANVLAHGTGAINVDGCRVGDGSDKGVWPITGRADARGSMAGPLAAVETDTNVGRWPANLIHDGSDEVLAGFPDNVKGAASNGRKGVSGLFEDGIGASQQKPGYGDNGSAARFFYCAKASKSDRGESNTHPTVKPTDLMRYLCRLVTPPGGTVLDPFTGSGSTGKAAKLEGFGFIGFELSAEYAAIAQARIDHAQ